MPKTKKSLLPRNLNTYDVYIEDRTPTSEYFAVSNLPPMFTGGRNSFLINGSALLEEGSEVRIEILDANRKPVFFYPVRNYTESAGKLISVEIYDTTTTGIATIIIMGIAKQKADGTSIPEVWKNKFNVRWAKNILIDGAVPNTSPLRFLNPPQVTVEERILERAITASFEDHIVDFTASLSPQLKYGQLSGYTVSAVSPSKFTSLYVNGVITGSLTVRGVHAPVSVSISSILNSNTAFSNEQLIDLDGRKLYSIILRSGSYTADIENVQTTITSSTKLKYSVLNTPTRETAISYASLRISGLNTVSGEINKVRVYVKPASSFVDYKLVGDAILAPSELLTTPTSVGDYPIGAFTTASSALQFWYAGPLVRNQGLNASVYPLSGSSVYYTVPSGSSIPLTVSSEILLSSLAANIPVVGTQFSGSVSQSGYFIGTRNSVLLFPTTEYTLTFDAYYTAQSGSVVLTGNLPRVDIYLVGRVATDDPLGQKLATIEPVGNTQWYHKKQINFFKAGGVPDDTAVRFVVHNGFWQFSNISIQPATDKLFSPDEAILLIPNTEYTKDVLQYKIEFFDINNNSSGIRAISVPTFFTGSAADYGILP